MNSRYEYMAQAHEAGFGAIKQTPGDRIFHRVLEKQ
jgi:hypothetical protein